VASGWTNDLMTPPVRAGGNLRMALLEKEVTLCLVVYRGGSFNEQPTGCLPDSGEHLDLRAR
jgi:hypothetical protein